MKPRISRPDTSTHISSGCDLRAAITTKARHRRNWVQIALCSFALTGLSTNVLATGGHLTTALARWAGGAFSAAPLALFLFFWLITQSILWMAGGGVLTRMLTCRADTAREALDDIFGHRRH